LVLFLFVDGFLDAHLADMLFADRRCGDRFAIYAYTEGNKKAACEGRLCSGGGN
jgi:hypothetical protein